MDLKDSSSIISATMELLSSFIFIYFHVEFYDLTFFKKISRAAQRRANLASPNTLRLTDLLCLSVRPSVQTAPKSVYGNAIPITMSQQNIQRKI
jgi:hypothetical protein